RRSAPPGWCAEAPPPMEGTREHAGWRHPGKGRARELVAGIGPACARGPHRCPRARGAPPPGGCGMVRLPLPGHGRVLSAPGARARAVVVGCGVGCVSACGPPAPAAAGRRRLPLPRCRRAAVHGVRRASRRMPDLLLSPRHRSGTRAGRGDGPPPAATGGHRAHGPAGRGRATADHLLARGIEMTRILVAPLEFKGSLTAGQAARAIAAGVRAGWPEAEVTVLPLADGGPGTADALVEALDGRWHTAWAHDALGRPLEAQWASWS